MGQFEQKATKLSLALLLAGGGLISMCLQSPQSAYAAPAHASRAASVSGPTWYGAGSTTWMVEATINIWPQPWKSNYCGVETSIGMINYDALNSGAAMPKPSSSNPVTTIINDNNRYNTQTVSQWGYATPTNSTAGYTNIAADFGTDPRSVAYMSWNYSINNRWFHDYIYRWQFSGNSSNQATDATTLMSRGLEAFGEPVVAFINEGGHAVLVTGVYSYTDPANSFPAQLDEVSIRDPEGTPNYTASSDTSHFTVSIDQWTTYGGNNALGWHYDLWSQYYNNYANPPKDPDPQIGIYSGGNHWFGGYTWVQRDNNTGYTGPNTPDKWDPDWAFNGYTGGLMWNP